LSAQARKNHETYTKVKMSDNENSIPVDFSRFTIGPIITIIVCLTLALQNTRLLSESYQTSKIGNIVAEVIVCQNGSSLNNGVCSLNPTTKTATTTTTTAATTTTTTKVTTTRTTTTMVPPTTTTTGAMIKSRKYSECESLYHEGKWKNFTQHGFSRQFENKTIKSIYEANYPFVGYQNLQGKFTSDQKFSGTWVGESECELKMLTLTDQEKKKCFNGTTKMMLFGDSRTRQLYSSMSSYLMKIDTFYDTKSGHNDKQIKHFPGVLDLSYTWSNQIGFDLDQTFTIGLDAEINDNESSKSIIGIIGGHFLWTLKENLLTDMLDNEEDFVKKLFTNLFIDNIVPWIKKTIDRTDKITLIFLGSHPPVALYTLSTERLISVRKASFEYNRQLREVIEGIGSERVKFVDAIYGIGMSPGPDSNPLIPDGTHLNLRMKRVNQVDTHLAINGILINTYCRSKLDASDSGKTSSKYCCF